MDLKKTGVFISLILRHKPDVIGISLDEHGWANVQELISGINKTQEYSIDMTMLEEIVRTDNKQRYSFNEDRSKIRANAVMTSGQVINLKKLMIIQYLQAMMTILCQKFQQANLTGM